MGSKQTLILAAVAAIAGIVWGHMRHRDEAHQRSHAVLQGLEWFVAVGGAAAAIELIREAIEGRDLEVTERLTHTRQTVTDQVGNVFSH